MCFTQAIRINTIGIPLVSGAFVMLLHIPGLFEKDEVQRIREALEQAD